MFDAYAMFFSTFLFLWFLAPAVDPALFACVVFHCTMYYCCNIFHVTYSNVYVVE